MNIARTLHTLRYLRLGQIAARLRYELRQRIRARTGWRLALPDRAPVMAQLRLAQGIAAASAWQGKNRFEFLNVAHEFPGEIDWNEPTHGKLWTYHLNCFEFLNQANMTPETGAALLRAFTRARATLKDGLEPYPISLRLVNWVKFNARFARQPDDEECRFFYAQARLLTSSLERHLLGNHYLENGFGLLFAAAAFGNARWLRLARRILIGELNEQILGDGAHFERSPMYHRILSGRVLDALNLTVSNRIGTKSDLSGLLTDQAAAMLGWLQATTFGNGDSPLVNDAATGMAPSAESLTRYGQRLLALTETRPKESALADAAVARRTDDCGYRMIRQDGFELFCDVGPVGPDYIPGHAHADTLSFVLYAGGKPVIIDPGVSTYEKNARRQQERGTAFHNTVVVNGRDSSEVWGGFRVGRRARITVLRESPTALEAAHDGYGAGGHKRRWDWGEPSRITIEDQIRARGKASFHCHPSVEVRCCGEDRVEAGGLVLHFTDASRVAVEEYACPDGFNRLRSARRIEVEFEGKLKTTISAV